MDDGKLVSMLGNALGTGTGLAVTLLILWRVIVKIVERWIAALDRIAVAVSEHTKTDLEHHAAVREAVIRLDAKVDAALDWRERTPVEDVPLPPQRRDPTSERRRLRTVPSGHRTKPEE
jgi:hypothetical protein